MNGEHSNRNDNRDADGNENEHHPCQWIGKMIAIFSQGDEFSKSKHLQKERYSRYNTHLEQLQTSKTTVGALSFICRHTTATLPVEDETFNRPYRCTISVPRRHCIWVITFSDEVCHKHPSEDRCHGKEGENQCSYLTWGTGGPQSNSSVDRCSDCRWIGSWAMSWVDLCIHLEQKWVKHAGNSCILMSTRLFTSISWVVSCGWWPLLFC